ncbi:unnamed protein product [Rhizoctonia solani]|uniref:Uncharacterized protein n=1 Tax=Rhizoctonia solani TaxID=456999 RepID=A0A8H3AVD0_9AGAM|nr:unnamed protein product [Rhizoctonia solani]
MAKFPLLLRPPTLAPGSSHYISNASIIAARVALGLDDPVRIQFDNLGEGAKPLANWCRRRQHDEVESMQLRREKKAPFFHQYIAFRLANNEGCFRIDRRQLPDEGSPLDCTEEAGVEAYETIEEINDMEQSIYSPSEPLVQVDFKSNFRVELIIDLCREISRHERAYMYTVQRYNCYFYAQTLLLCTVCSENDWYEKYLWHSCPIEPSDTAYPELLPSTQYDSAWKVPFRLMVPQRKNSQPMKEANIGELQGYLSEMIRAHAARVEQYKVLLKCNAVEVEQDIKQTMNDIWGRNSLLLGQVEEVKAVVSNPVDHRTGHRKPQGLKRRSRVSKKGPDDWVRVPRRGFTTDF